MAAATQNPLEAFIWGAGGSKKTPEEIARDKEIAAEMLMKAGNTSPVQHWTQGAARVADALSGVIKQKRAERAGEENATYNQGILSELFKGGSTPAASAPASVSSAIPASGASAEVAATSPAIAAVPPTFANDGTELGGYLSDPALRAKLPAGMRNNNPGNIKFVGQTIPGIVGPSVNTDQGDPQAVFATPEAGMNAMFQLAKRKYDGGKKTADQLIAGNMGWTPGNHAAAANVAASMGLSPHDDINLNDPAMAAKFVRGLIIQEHGKSGSLYPESMVLSAIGGQPPVEVASAQPQTATDAIEQQAPMPVADQGLSGEVAAFRGTPEALAAFPGRQEQAMPAQQPTAVQQVAQALPAAGQTQQAVPGMSEALLRAISDPRATPQTRAVAQALMQQQSAQQAQAAEQQQWMARQQYEQAQQQNDPLRRIQLEKGQLELDQARNPKPGFRTLTTDEKKQLGLPANGAFQAGADGKISQIGGGGVTVNNEGSIPAGYQAIRDAEGRVTSIEPIAGSPAALAADQAKKTTENQGGRKDVATDVITNAASNARQILKDGWMTTGTPGRVAANLSESPAAELRRQIGVLKSQATIETLSAMRQASPTGGAMGAVSDKEGDMLAAAAGAIDPNADKADVVKALDNYERTLLRVIHGPKVGDAIFDQTRAQKPVSEMTDEELEALSNGD